jgi:16S rRNA G966 N2-methylase RsmD
MHAAVLSANLALLKLEPRTRVLVQGNRSAFRLLEAEGRTFDLVLVDPPFSRDAKVLPPDVFEDLEALAGSAVWAPGGTLVLEHRGGHPPFPVSLVPEEQRDYGDATVSFFRKA